MLPNSSKTTPPKSDKKIVIRNGKTYEYDKKRYSKAADVKKISKPVFPHYTFSNLADDYENSLGFDSLRDSTKPYYILQINRMRRFWENLDLGLITLQHVESGYLVVKKAKGVGSARTFCTVTKIIFNYAVGRNLIPSSPAARLKPVSGGSYPTMSPETFVEAMACCPEWLRRAVWLAALLAQRRSDIAALTWADWTGTRFEITQIKTGAQVSIPVPPDAVPILQAMRGSPETPVIVGADGQAISGKRLSNAFRYYLRSRGVAGLSAGMNMHSLRKMRLTQMALGQATMSELMAVSGHTSASALKPYIDMSNRGRFADAAVAKAPPLPFSSEAGKTGNLYGKTQ